MLLAIDIGNTNIKFGLFSGNSLIHTWHVKSKQRHTGIGLFKILKKKAVPLDAINFCVIGSVIPPLTHVCQTLCTRYLKKETLTIGPKTKLPLPISCNRKTLGADRLADVVAASAQYGKKTIVIGLGTATVFNVINRNGEFVGGAITVGLATSMKALANSAALLSGMPLSHPSKVVGTNTRENIQSGIVFGHICMIDGMIRRIENELGYTMQVVATGGNAQLLRRNTQSNILINKALTLEGLRAIWEYNHQTYVNSKK